MIVLGIESSCDETSVAIIDNGVVKTNLISSQLIHSKYGGVVPELASRAHIETIGYLYKEALQVNNLSIYDINLLAVTYSPGLMGALLVGVNFAKGVALKNDIPIVPVNHIEGHLYSPCLEDRNFNFPFISLVVSGGHTALFLVKSYEEYDIIGLTKDDAAGEAFDKIAKMLGLPYPGGPEMDKLAKTGNPKAFDFPRSMIHSGDYNFSFSGLKTSVRYYVNKNYPEGIPNDTLNDFCASIQSAIVDVLVKKTLNAAKEFKIKNIAVAGGVSANSYLRQEFQRNAEKHNLQLVIPQGQYCVDNAAMIAFLAQKKYEANPNLYNNLDFTANPNAMRAKR